MRLVLIQVGLFWLLVPMVHAESAFEGSRLFMTPEQRTLIDLQLTDQNTENTLLEPVDTTIGDAVQDVVDSPGSTAQLPVFKSLSFDGLVVRPHDNSAVLWVNGNMKSPRQVHRIGGEQVRILSHGVNHVLAPGQKKRIKTWVGKSDG